MKLPLPEIFIGLEDILEFTANYDSVLEKKEGLVASLNDESINGLSDFIRDEEFQHLKLFLKKMNEFIGESREDRHFFSKTTSRIHFLKRMKLRNELRRIIMEFRRLYHDYFNLYNSLRHQLSALKDKDIIRFKQLYDEQLRTLTSLESMNLHLVVNHEISTDLFNFSLSLAPINKRIGQWTSHLKEVFYSTRTFSRSFSVNLIRLFTLLILLNSSIVLAQDKTHQRYMEAIFNHVAEVQKPVSNHGYEFYHKIFESEKGFAQVMIYDHNSDNKLRMPQDDMMIRIVSDGLNHLRTIKGSQFLIAFGGGPDNLERARAIEFVSNEEVNNAGGSVRKKFTRMKGDVTYSSKIAHFAGAPIVDLDGPIWERGLSPQDIDELIQISMHQIFSTP